MKDLLEAGVHFGHQTKRWNPKMKQYIFGERNGIYIIDLGKTAKLFREAEQFVDEPRGRGTHDPVRRHQAPGAGRDRRRSAALRHVLRQRALARRPAHQLHDDPAQPRAAARPRGDGQPTAATSRCRRRKSRGSRRRSASSQKNLDGIRHMARLPDAIFVVDTRKEKIAVDEARKLKIPVIGVVDTNCDPDEVDYVIPGNDDALRAIRLFASRIADAVDRRVAACASPRRRTRPRTPKATSGARRGRRAPGAARAGHVAGVGLRRRRSGLQAAVGAAHAGPIDGRRFHVPLGRARPARWKLTALRSSEDMAITAALVKKLRDQTGAGMMECKAALDRGQRRHRGGHDDPAQARARAGRRRRPDARPAKGSSAATSTWAARSACSSRSTASRTSSRAPTTSRTS